MRPAIIDRFEGDFAVLEVDGEERPVPRALLPEDAKEGDRVDLETLKVDEAGTEALKDRVAAARARAKKNPFTGGKL